MTRGEHGAALSLCGAHATLVFRWQLLLAALLLLVGLERAAARAPSPEPGAVWAVEWAVIGAGVEIEEAGALSGLQWAGPKGTLQIERRANSGRFVSLVRDMGRDFMALGALWQAKLPAGSRLALEARVSADGKVWQPWQKLEPDELGAERPSATWSHSELLFGWGRYVQLRATLERSTRAIEPTLEALKLVAIDASAGPEAPSVEMVGVASAGAPPPVISRAGWGANEAWMTWPPSYATVVKVVVHHTSGSNSTVDADPAAFVRTIYYYHAVTLKWGDIGYNYLIDRQGRIYEGRFGGPGVIGGHARPYNSGTIGVALLGTYSTQAVPSAAVAGLESFLVWKCDMHRIDPLGSGWLYDRTLPNIMGHRDCNPTTCPGDRAYALLPQIRNNVTARLPLGVTLLEPAPEEWLGGVRTIRWQTTSGASQVTVAVDGQVRRTLPASETSWAWNTTTEAEGTRRLRVTASNSLGNSSHVEVLVQIDNTPPSGAMSAPALTRQAGVTLQLSCQGCTTMQFGRGWRWEGEDLRHQIGSLAADPAAANGRAWRGQAGVDGWGAWYGPYFCGLPAPGDYEAVFWLRCGRNDLADSVAMIDVSDHEGIRFLAGPLPVRAIDFAALGRYQPFTLPFRYGSLGTSCARPEVQDGLELRTWFQGTADLWLDRVEIFTAPQTFASSAWFDLPQADGRYTVEVRFKDAAGNASPVYAQVVTVDRTPPAWEQPGASGLPVSDALSGLAATAAYSLSDDGIQWGSWVPVTPSLAADGRSGTVPAQPEWRGRCVRARVEDRAGNLSYSPPVRWPLSGDPNPQYCWWASCGARTYLPLVLR